MKYDDASWHYGRGFPEGLPPEAGATHIGMFAAWAAASGLIGALHTEDAPEMLDDLLNRSTTPGAWFIRACDEKFTDEDLNPEGNAFAQAYYLESEPPSKARKYLSDYADTFPEFEDLYRVPDDWGTFERLKPVIDSRFAEWKSPRPTGWRRLFR